MRHRTCSIFAHHLYLLSFTVDMREQLNIPPPYHGRVWVHAVFNPSPRAEHRHDELEFNLVTAGRAGYLVGNTRQELRAGSLIWLFPEHDHLLIDQSADFAMWILVIKPRPLRAACSTPFTKPLLKTNPTGSICRVLEPSEAVELEKLCLQVETDEQEPARFNAGLVYLLLRAWGAFDNAEHVVRGTDVHPAVERAARLLQDDATLDLPQLEARCGMSADRLSRLFRRQTGASITNYRNRIRIERFVAEYSHDTTINMTTAALEVGFGSYAQFHRVFKQQMKCSPAAYKRKRRP